MMYDFQYIFGYIPLLNNHTNDKKKQENNSNYMTYNICLFSFSFAYPHTHVNAKLNGDMKCHMTYETLHVECLTKNNMHTKKI